MTMMIIILSRLVGWFIWGFISGGFTKVANGDKNEWFSLTLALIVIAFIPFNHFF